MSFEMGFTSMLVLLAGQLSFIFGAASFWSKDLLHLRLWQAASGVLGIGFNSYLIVSGVNVGLSLGSVVFWLTVFLAINLYRSAKMLIDRLEVPLPADHKALFARAFPMMHSRDVALLINSAEKLLFSLDDQSTELEILPESVYLLVEGTCLVKRPSVGFLSIQRGDLIGGVSFLSHSAKAEQGPLKIIESGSILRWDVALLRKITEEDDQLEAALTDGFARQFSDDFLRGEVALYDSKTPCNFNLDVDKLRINAESFPFMSQSQLLRLIEKAQDLSLGSNEVKFGAYKLLCLYEGDADIYNDDSETKIGHLPVHQNIYRRSTHDAETLCIRSGPHGAKVICWEKKDLDLIEFEDPRLYVTLMKCILEQPVRVNESTSQPINEST